MMHKGSGNTLETRSTGGRESRVWGGEIIRDDF